MQQHDSKYFACRPPNPKCWGQKVKIHFFQNMVILHIKLNGIASAFSAIGIKCQFFSESSHVAYQIRRAPCKHMFCSYTHPRPLGRGQRSNISFLKVVMLYIKIKEMEYI